MKVFISSLIAGMEAERAAVRRAIEVLGHQPVLAEEFGARATSPQVACLSAVREADLIVLVLGQRYGTKQPSGFSATHEEFKEAQGQKPILTFIEEGNAEPEQATLIQEASGWERGLFRDTYASAQELGDKVSRAFHNHVVASASAPLNPDALKARALEMLRPEPRDGGSSALELAIASGPAQAVLRPAQIEEDALAKDLQQRALFGAPALFDVRTGTSWRLAGEALVIEQGERQVGGARVTLWPSGDLLLQLPMDRSARGMGFSAIIHEEVGAKLAAALAFAAWVLDRVDPTQRITHVGLSARVLGGGAFGWRTEREHTASPNSGQMMGFGQEAERDAPVTLVPAHMARPALTMNAPRLAEDLLALLRRNWTRQ